ncbi:hypothetical protein ISS03_04945 [Patescibacteria group bacterium]|nr:hypothetical protein [Patescibacteria group bacterium]
MLNFAESFLIMVFSVLPEADLNNDVIPMVDSAFNTISPLLQNLNLIFPISTLFSIMLLIIFVELSIFLLGLIMKGAGFFRR